jgi:ectoine hydroxylase-related dioxygenase (phytanoyl-CoA dioxygenase family)
MIRAPLLDANAFERDGYAVVRGILPAELIRSIGAFLAAAEPEATATLRDALHIAPGDDLCASIETALRRDDGSLPKAVRDVAMGHYPLEVRLSERLWEIARVEALRALLAIVLGDNRIFMHLPPTCRFVLPGSRTAGVPPHQDRSYNGHLPRFVTAWIPFVPIDDLCGGVAIYTGGSRELRDVAERTGPWIGACRTDDLQRVQPDFELGDVLLLSDWVVHASVPNASQHTRRSIDYRFFAGGRSAKHALDLETFAVIEPAPTE